VECFSSSTLCGQQLNSTTRHTAVLLAKTFGYPGEETLTAFGLAARKRQELT